MNGITLACVLLSITVCLEARRYTGNSHRPDGPIIEPFPPIPPSTLTCEFGRQIDQQGLCSNFGVRQCPNGFFCNFGPADEPGPCCLRNNPCRRGTPFQLGGDAVSCNRQSCPSGFRCTRGRSFAVCCPVSGTNPGPYPVPGRLRPCPNIFCAAVSIPPQCRKERIITNSDGSRCLGCPQNICQNNSPYPG